MPVNIDEMSGGYRTVTALVTDIVRQINDCLDGDIDWAMDDSPAIHNSGGR